MEWQREWKPLAAIVAVFLAFFYLPVGRPRFDNAVLESLYRARSYAQEHVLLCLIPAFFIAGAIAVFVSQASVLKYLGARANKVLAYGVASVSGGLLAVCSCTVLPLFAGIYSRGAGLGPAAAFLYSGPAINVLAIILTARILGLELGVARAVGAVVFSIVIGLLMHLVFRREEQEKAAAQLATPEPEVTRPLAQNAGYFFTMVAILVFANWGEPKAPLGLWSAIYASKWLITDSPPWLWDHADTLVRRSLAQAALAPCSRGLGPSRAPAPPVVLCAAIVGLSIVLATTEAKPRWFASTWGSPSRSCPCCCWGY